MGLFRTMQVSFEMLPSDFFAFFPGLVNYRVYWCFLCFSACTLASSCFTDSTEASTLSLPNAFLARSKSAAMPRSILFSSASYFTPLMEQLGFDHTPHDTRHTCISLLTEADVNPSSIKKIVGHSGAMTLTERVYTHLDIQILVDAINRIL